MNTLQFQKKIMDMQENMFNFAMILTADKEESRDLLQETTLKVLENQEKYVANVNLRGWVLTIMRNIFINNYRRILRSQIVIDQTEELYHLNLSQTSGIDTPESIYTIKEINDAVNSLKEDMKIPFFMLLSGYSYNEIAEILELPLGTIKSRIFFARQELQSSLKDMR